MKKILKFSKRTIFFSLIIIVLSFFVGCNNPELSIITDTNPGVATEHGLTKLTDVLEENDIAYEKVSSVNEANGSTIIVTGLSDGDGEASKILKAQNHTLPQVPEALTIWRTNWQKKAVWLVSGFDDRGLMYGILDVADRIGWNNDEGSLMSEVIEITEEPDAPERAVSIYTMNRKYWESRFYNEAYWTKYLDNLAKNRFNSLVLIFGYENGGFLAPCYPYFFDVENFPDVHMVGISSEEQQRNLNALNNLVEMAHDRGINFTVGIWDHIYRGGVQGGGIAGTKDAPDEPQEHLVWGVNAENLVSYTKAGLRRFIELVPNIDAIQLRIHWESGLNEEEQLTFFPEIFQIVKEIAPDIRLDLRAKELPDEIIEDALDMDINFRIATKYWMEQMGMPYHPTNTNPERSHRRHGYEDMLVYPQRYKIHWRLWNGGTSRILLWGDPEYTRRFVASTHLYDGDGFEINEPLATKMEAQPHDMEPFELLNSSYQYYDYEFERYWHFFQVFGRIGYNPNVSSDIWEREFQQRFGKEAGPLIEEAIHKASWVLPRILTSIFPYREFPMTRGWAEKERLGDLPEYSRNRFSDMPQFASFDDEAKLLIDGGESAKILPSENSYWFKQTSEDINELIMEAEKVKGDNTNKEFISTITDLKILSNLALFHSRRIPAAVSYCLFKRTNDVSALEEAIAYERKAIEAWQQIVTAANDVYTENLMLGVCNAGLCGHWRGELNSLNQGIENLENIKQNFEIQDNVEAPTYKAFSKTSKVEIEISDQSHSILNVGEPLTVSIKTSAPSGIKWIRLRHRNVNQELEYKTTEMLPTEEDNTYQAIVPANEINPKWDYMYYIEIMDKDGNGTIYPDLNKETPYIIVSLNR